MLNLIVLLAIAWLLWLIREELAEMSERQRSLKLTLERLAERVDALANNGAVGRHACGSPFMATCALRQGAVGMNADPQSTQPARSQRATSSA